MAWPGNLLATGKTAWMVAHPKRNRTRGPRTRTRTRTGMGSQSLGGYHGKKKSCSRQGCGLQLSWQLLIVGCT